MGKKTDNRPLWSVKQIAALSHDYVAVLMQCSTKTVIRLLCTRDGQVKGPAIPVHSPWVAPLTVVRDTLSNLSGNSGLALLAYVSDDRITLNIAQLNAAPQEPQPGKLGDQCIQLCTIFSIQMNQEITATTFTIDADHIPRHVLCGCADGRVFAVPFAVEECIQTCKPFSPSFSVSRPMLLSDSPSHSPPPPPPTPASCSAIPSISAPEVVENKLVEENSGMEIITTLEVDEPDRVTCNDLYAYGADEQCRDQEQIHTLPSIPLIKSTNNNIQQQSALSPVTHILPCSTENFIQSSITWIACRGNIIAYANIDNYVNIYDMSSGKVIRNECVRPPPLPVNPLRKTRSNNKCTEQGTQSLKIIVQGEIGTSQEAGIDSVIVWHQDNSQQDMFCLSIQPGLDGYTWKKQHANDVLCRAPIVGWHCIGQHPGKVSDAIVVQREVPGWIITGSQNGSVYAWRPRKNASGFQPLLICRHGLKNKYTRVESLYVSPDNTLVYTGGEDGILQVHTIDPCNPVKVHASINISDQMETSPAARIL